MIRDILGPCATATERQDLRPRSRSIVVAHTTRRNGTRRSSGRFVRGMTMASNIEASKPLPKPSKAALRRMWFKISIPDACWEWKGSIKKCGYASDISIDGSRGRKGEGYLPHRLMYHWFKHDIPVGMTIDHLCNNPKCVNPDHMEISTHSANVSRAHKRAYCKRGHPQTPDNRYTSPGSGMSRCRPCMNTSRKERRKVKVQSEDSRKV